MNHPASKKGCNWRIPLGYHSRCSLLHSWQQQIISPRQLLVNQGVQRSIHMRPEALRGFSLRYVQLDKIALAVNLLHHNLAGQAGAHCGRYKRIPDIRRSRSSSLSHRNLACSRKLSPALLLQKLQIETGRQLADFSVVSRVHLHRQPATWCIKAEDIEYIQGIPFSCSKCRSSLFLHPFQRQLEGLSLRERTCRRGGFTALCLGQAGQYTLYCRHIASDHLFHIGKHNGIIHFEAGLAPPLCHFPAQMRLVLLQSQSLRNDYQSVRHKCRTPVSSCPSAACEAPGETAGAVLWAGAADGLAESSPGASAG